MSTSPIPFHVRTNTPRLDMSQVRRGHTKGHRSESQNATQPIEIPRRKTARPPPRSPMRHQASPDLVFNFDFSPCSFQGTGIIARMDARMRKDGDWSQPLLQQRGRTNVLLAHQCQQQQKLMFARKTRSPSLRNHRSLMRESVPVSSGIQDSVHTVVEHDALTEEADFGFDSIVGAEDLPLKSEPTSLSSVCSSVVFATPGAEIQPSESLHCADGHRYIDENDNLPLISAFQRSISSTSPASALTISLASHTPSPSSPIVFSIPSPVSPPLTRPYPCPGQRAYPLPTVFPVAGNKDRAQVQAHLRSAAAPVVSPYVAQAERADAGDAPVRMRNRSPIRGRSPYPTLGLRVRQRRSSSAAPRAPTVVGTGRVIGMKGAERLRGSSLALSNEDLERSLEEAREREKAEGALGGDAKEWECERGRTRGRPRGRGIGINIGIEGLRAPPERA